MSRDMCLGFSSSYADPMALRIIVAEDSLLMREGIRQVIDRQADLQVVADCADLPWLRALVDSEQPDVVVTDVRMPPTFGDEGIRFAVDIRDSHPGMGVVVLSHYAEPAYVRSLLTGGTSRRAYLLKERVSAPGELADAIRSVAVGGSVIDPAVVEVLVGASQRSPASPLRLLTTREREVLDQVAQGKSNAAVAASLYLSERAVEKNISTTFEKLGLLADADVNRRVAAVLMYLSDRTSTKGG
jgi:DNA-binding NarL/FixJ family response regulator